MLFLRQGRVQAILAVVVQRGELITAGVARRICAPRHHHNKLLSLLHSQSHTDVSVLHLFYSKHDVCPKSQMDANCHKCANLHHFGPQMFPVCRSYTQSLMN